MLLAGGLIWKLLRWALTPVPFSIPTTGGQERSLPWIRHARLDAPATWAGVAGRLLTEMLLFRSLWRNAAPQRAGVRLAFLPARGLWLAAMLFHAGLALTFLKHLRLFLDPVPRALALLESMDRAFFQGVPGLGASSLLLAASLFILLVRRLANARLRCLSLPGDYLPLLLLMGLAGTGLAMRCLSMGDCTQAKLFLSGLLHLAPLPESGLGPAFFTHLALASALFAILPFSKLVHPFAILFSPTRNLPCNTRERRRSNPWMQPAKFLTYAAYEDRFRTELAQAGLPLETPEQKKSGGQA